MPAAVDDLEEAAVGDDREAVRLQDGERNAWYASATVTFCGE